jgi:hypothetical protein
MDFDTKLTLATCHHEAGHAAVAWWFRCAFHDSELFIGPDGQSGGFPFRSFVNEVSIQLALAVENAEQRRMAIRDIEREMLRLLGGPVAEYRFHGNEARRAIRFSSEYRDPGSDSSRLRRILRALTGKDDKKYQLRLQEECKTIIGEPRMRQAIQVIADHLMRHRFMQGSDAEAVFTKIGAPRTTTW